MNRKYYYQAEISKSKPKILKNQVQNIPDFSGIFVAMAEHPKNFLIVDDHPVLADALAMHLKGRFPKAAVHTALNGLEGLDRLENNAIDIVLLDVNMPQMDGYQTFYLIKKKYPQLKVILLTQHGGKEMKEHFVKNGINGIVFKGEKWDIAEIVSTVWAGSNWFSPQMKELLGEQFINQQAGERKLPLSNRDRLLIRLLSKGKSTKEISSEMNLAENTINSYRQLLLKQTGAKNSEELVAFAYTNGLL
ncbi:MAG: response regulator [Flammeovirgaceae bacterium]